MSIHETLISFKTAELAKEKGFGLNSYTGFVYDNDGKLLNLAFYDMGDKYAAPTQSLLQKWLREEHEIHVSAFPVFSHKYFPTIRKFYKYKEYDNILGSPYNPNSSKDTYEEALEKGLQEALKLV